MKPVMSIDECGNNIWKLNGELHRTDGPAVEFPNGSMSWWDGGQLHRTDGPAITGRDGSKHWCLNGAEMSFDHWLDATTGLTEEEKVMYKLQYG
jgi:hypothetical protein